MKKTKMLKKNYEFRKVLTKGKCFFGKNIIAYIQKNNKQCNFLGLAISVKVAKAVRRNKIKRLIREVYFSCEEHMSIGYNIVFVWNKKAEPEKVCFHEIQKDINNIFNKSKIFKSY